MKSNYEENLAEEKRKTATAQRLSLTVKESYDEAETALAKCQKRMQLVIDDENYTQSDIEGANQRKFTLKCEIEILTKKSNCGVPYKEVYKGL